MLCIHELLIIGLKVFFWAHFFHFIAVQLSLSLYLLITFKFNSTVLKISYSRCVREEKQYAQNASQQYTTKTLFTFPFTELCLISS